MKKFISLFLSLLTVFSLCVCGTGALAEEPELSAAPAKENGKYLRELMAEFAENIQPGTAGASLKAVKEAVRLMDWGTETDMTAEEFEEVFEEFFSDKDDEFLQQYREQMEQLDETYQLLLTEGQEGLLESAGCTDTAYPWGGEPIDTVETFFEILGLRIYTGDYTEFLETYYKAVEEKWSLEEVAMAGININVREFFNRPDALDFFGFAVRDVNNDGIEELLIGFMNDMETVCDLYTVYNGNRELVIQGGTYNENYFVCSDGTICKYTYFAEKHKGYHYYTLKNGWLVCFGSIICDDSYNPYNIWYIGTDDDWDISKCSYFPPDMVLQQVAKYEALYVDNDYTPFSALHK